jgi:Dolichyl-phosphate-mannose-protein mannosyltransferase
VKRFGPFALLGLAEILIFFHNPGHFFVSDSLKWMRYRSGSFGEFLSGFLQVDPFFWYRPLAQRTLESLLFPIVGLSPLPYRIVGFVLFFACTLAVFLLAETLTESRRVAWFSVLVFTPHVVHAFTTYDVAFTPELLFTLFYIGSAVFYVRFLRSNELSYLMVSCALFAGSLFSKEAAASLPFTLLAIWFLLPRKERGTDWFLFPHFAILGVYLAFAVGYLHVRHIHIDNILTGSASSVSEYPFGVGRHILLNLQTALSWAFGIPGGGLDGSWTFRAPVMLTVLKILRVVTCMGAVCVLFNSKRNFLILGMVWFLIAAAPMLPLIDHFLPYYLFAPLAGFALAVGTILDWAYSQCLKLSPRAAVAMAALILGVWAGIHATTANLVAINHSLLGGSARVSSITESDIHALYPSLPEGARLVIFNEDVPHAVEDHVGGGGMLLQLTYNNPALITDYVTEGLSIPEEDVRSGKVLAFKWTDDHLVEITELVRQRPELLKQPARGTNYHLEVSTAEVRSGMGSYTLRIPEIRNAAAIVLYALDGKVMEPFRVDLDSRGEVHLDVPAGTKLGTYTFVAVRRENEQGWVPVSRSLLVR